jgi:hypothetical protein
VALADDIDPFVDVFGGDPTEVINLGGITNGFVNVQPNDNADTTIYQLFNDTGSIVTSLKIETTIDTGLNAFFVEHTAFSISQGGAGYFKNQSLTYTPGTGDLIFSFSGVNPGNGDETCGLPGSPADCEINEQEGIPPGGTFTVQLGGWSNNASFNGTPLYSGQPHFTDSFTDEAPEPAMFLASGAGLLLIVGMVQFRRRRLAAVRTR